MEEADLLKERLQAITDKRKIREDIARKRQEIEEEKLKLQYIKKKALREQWLMDGLSQQTQEELEAMKQQAQDEQQQSDQLQSNIHRIEKEISDLETEELQLSTNEEVILKRLKEVERTNEDIIKEFQEEIHSDASHPDPILLPNIAAIFHSAAANLPTMPDNKESKKATFAMEIQVEHDKRTGKSQVVSTVAVTAEALQERGLKVYDDGRKCIYALNTSDSDAGEVGEMTPGEVEELLLQATEKDVPTDVQYHKPVYSAAYDGSSRSSTPRSQSLTPKLRGSSRPSSQLSQRVEGQRTPETTVQSKYLNPKDVSPVPNDEEDIPGYYGDENHLEFCPLHPDKEGSEEHLNIQHDSQGLETVVSVKVRSDEVSLPIQQIFTDTDSGGQSPEEDSEAWTQMDSLPTDLESGPVTMIFMGYERAEEEEEGFQAELVVIDGGSDDENLEERVQHEDDCLSYHPEGYKSKVFKPRTSVARVSSSGEISDDDISQQDSVGNHKPTFTHKSGYLQRRNTGGSDNKDRINMEKMSSTER